MAKSRSKTQTSLIDMLVKRQRIKSLVSRIEVQSPQGNVQEGQRLMIIKLRKYNQVRELLIENGTTGS